MKCDFCDQPGMRLVGESNGVIVCQDHVPADPECMGLCGEHHWLDRPESDTRVCLICDTEVTG